MRGSGAAVIGDHVAGGTRRWHLPTRPNRNMTPRVGPPVRQPTPAGEPSHARGHPAPGTSTGLDRERRRGRRRSFGMPAARDVADAAVSIIRSG